MGPKKRSFPDVVDEYRRAIESIDFGFVSQEKWERGKDAPTRDWVMHATSREAESEYERKILDAVRSRKRMKYLGRSAEKWAQRAKKIGSQQYDPGPETRLEHADKISGHRCGYCGQLSLIGQRRCDYCNGPL